MRQKFNFIVFKFIAPKIANLPSLNFSTKTCDFTTFEFFTQILGIYRVRIYQPKIANLQHLNFRAKRAINRISTPKVANLLLLKKDFEPISALAFLISSFGYFNFRVQKLWIYPVWVFMPKITKLSRLNFRAQNMANLPRLSFHV